MTIYEESLEYHSRGPRENRGHPSSRLRRNRICRLAYSPGVEPCRMIAEKEAVLRTRLRNLVAVVSNGTAVLGLGHWSGRRKTRNGRKGVLQKFADIDVFDIELNAKSRRRDPGLRDARAYLWRINLEDIKAPECFTLRRVEKAPGDSGFHDDQHGTAVISGAAF